MEEIENQINENHDKIFDLAPIEDNLNKIILSITPSYVTKEKEKMMNEINNCQKKLDESKDRLNPKENVDAINMLNYFKKKLNLLIDLKDVQNLNKEFNAERRKYF